MYNFQAYFRYSICQNVCNFCYIIGDAGAIQYLYNTCCRKSLPVKKLIQKQHEALLSYTQIHLYLKRAYY